MKPVEIQQLSHNKILIRSGNRFLVYDKGKVFEFNFDNGLSSKSFNCFYPDIEGNIWIGTLTNGLNKLKRNTFNSNINEHLFKESVRAIYQMRDSSIWIGFKHGQLQYIDKNKVLHNFPKRGESSIYSILEDRKGNKWIGTYSQGIYQYKANGDSTFLRSEGIFKPAFIRALFEDSKGVIWIGAEDGIHKFEHNDFKKIEGVGYENVTCVTESSKGVIYYGSFDGIGVIDGKHHSALSGFAKCNVRCIYEDKQGVVWVGTYGAGLIRYKNGYCFNFGAQNGMLNQYVSSIVEDEFGFLWMSSNQGMYRVEKNSLNNLAEGKSKILNSRNYLSADGLRNVEFNGGMQNSACTDNNGSIWFPTLSGVVTINPTVIIAQNQPKILIESISIDGQDFNLSNKPVINSTNNEIQIRYTIPTFSFSENVRFQYKLEGKHSDWVNAGSRRTAYFSNLSGGDYVFKVRSYEDPTNEVSFSFNVPIQLWYRTWFIACEILLGMLILYLLVRYRIRSIKMKEKAKTELNKEFAALELKALQAQMNPHFIFNALNSIQHFYLINDELQANEYMGKFSSLMRMFLEHSKSPFITLKEEVDLLKLYIDLENLQFENPFDIEFDLNPEIEGDFIEIPGM
ncbi:MAG: histidine kinase, partial [Crocinitomicaceae bacterium]|nr:histidine kinase [Crocinitomicaceae bacterium]